MDSPSPHPATHQPERQRANDQWLRRLRVLGVGLPAAFIVALQVARPLVFDRVSPRYGDEIVSGLTALAAVVFGLVMFRVIGRLVEDDRLHATVAERDRIARELHDSLAQVLGATQLRLKVLGMHPVVAAEPDLRTELDDVAGTCQEAYHDVREAILGLRVGPQSDRTLVDGLRSYADKFGRQSGITTTVESTGVEPSLTPHREVQVIRVVQEALTNARKHSGARSARIVVAEEGEWAVFVVEDDGCGFRPGATGAPDGFGLHSMRERAELVGGRLDIDSRPGAGTRVRVTVPRTRRTPRGLAVQGVGV